MPNCHFVFYDGWVAVSPTVISLAKVLGKHFDNVILYCQKNGFKKYEFEEKNIKTHYIHNSIYWKKADKPKNFFSKVQKILKKGPAFEKDDLMVCTDDVVLKYFAKLARECGNKYVYLSLELPQKKVEDKEQIEAFKNSDLILIQDEIRLQNLLDFYGVNRKDLKQNVVFLPNDSLPTGNPKAGLKNVLEQFKNFPQNKTVCASIGMIGAPVFSRETAEAFYDIDNAVLLLHNGGKTKMRPYIKDMLAANQKNLYLSRINYDSSDLKYVYDPIDIGLATYDQTNWAGANIGRASGKLAFYLKYKKPVIVNKVEGFSDIIEKYDCGVELQDIHNKDEWRAAVEKIMGNYEYYSKNAHKCYLAEFSFEEKIKPFEDYLKMSECACSSAG